MGTCQSNVADDGASCYDCLQGAGNCDACSAGVCADGEICQEPAQASVTTTHAAGNNHRGNMFDIIATNTIKIVSLDVSPMRATEVEVYFRPGSYQGHVPSPDGWTLIGSAQVPLAAPETLVPLPLTIDVTIPAGETYGFYVTSTNTEIALHYSNGTSEGAPDVSNSDLTVTQGIGLEYPFTRGSGQYFTPRIWNGAIHYKLPDADPTLGTTVLPMDEVAANGAMFDLVALQDVSLRALFLELTEGSYDGAVYFRRGSFVGFEDASTGWEPIGGGLGIESLGPDTLTEVPFTDGIVMSAGETIGVYVDFAGQSGLRFSAADSVGAVVNATPELEWRAGRAFDASFAGAGAPAVVRGAVQYPVCE
ncbi:MAG TPA: hypothetical protein VK013_10285 [Myxococcaceae bacterium]|nr:hypothetical protein [Myxococcaceae bacterium]